MRKFKVDDLVLVKSEVGGVHKLLKGKILTVFLAVAKNSYVVKHSKPSGGNTYSTVGEEDLSFAEIEKDPELFI